LSKTKWRYNNNSKTSTPIHWRRSILSDNRR